jgi:hypothetical protein
MEPHLDFERASKDFQETIRQYLILQKKELSEALNKKALDVTIKAIRHTKRADKEAIRRYLETNRIKYKLVSKKGVPRDETGIKAKRLLSAKLRSAGYIRAGWYKAAQALGGRGGKVRPKGLAARGSGKKATTRDLTARIINEANGASSVGKPALALAMREAQADMMKYIHRKMQESWGKAGRRR